MHLILFIVADYVEGKRKKAKNKKSSSSSKFNMWLPKGREPFGGEMHASVSTLFF